MNNYDEHLAEMAERATSEIDFVEYVVVYNGKDKFYEDGYAETEKILAKEVYRDTCKEVDNGIEVLAEVSLVKRFHFVATDETEEETLKINT